MKKYKDAVVIRNSLRNKIIDKIDISDFGATITPKGKKLSPGCYSCKSGAWMCVYIGTQCNLRCNFCPQSKKSKNKNLGLSVSGGDGKIKSLDDFRKVMDKGKIVEGIGFSGGEPFFYLNDIYDWLDVIKDEYSDRNIYLWIYTNGKLVTEDSCKKLKDKGLNEIRFDLAATNYDDDEVIEKLRYCKKIFDKIAVEVPVPWYTDRLISILPKLDEIGVDYLNLHEMIITEYNKNRLEFDNNIPSIFDIYKVIEYIEENNLNIIYNDCSSINKTLQQFGFEYQRYMQDGFNFEWEDFLKFNDVEILFNVPNKKKHLI